MNYKKTFFIIILFFTTQLVNAQFLTKISIGLKAGTNFTIVNPINKYSVFDDIILGSNSFEKEYKQLFSNYGSQFSFLVYYTLSDKFYLSFQPAINNHIFKYENQYNWQNSSSSQILNYAFEQNLQYVDLPLIVKYEFSKRKLQPFAQIGTYYGVLLNSTKNINKTITNDFGSFEYNKEALGSNTNYLRSNIGLIGGFGLTYKFSRSKLGLETNFRYGLHIITDKHNRFLNSQITGKYYDVPDDIKMMNATVSLVYIVSLKCLKQTVPPSHREL